ncbi:MAG: CotH kinase family protein, partial [Planctomycetaceae bacterium]|nr:CotH kinase family protein [Planctomycetaceae bacterium]
MLRFVGLLVGAVGVLAAGLLFGFSGEESNTPPNDQFAQRGDPPTGPDGRPAFDRGRFGRGGPPGFGPGGPPGFGPGREDRKLVKEYDKDGNGRLNAKERAEARKAIGDNRRGGFGGPRGFGPRGGSREPGKPGPRVSPDNVEIYPDAPLYDLDVVRTLFLEFENEDWEDELAAFKDSDVEVPATLTVDGKKYEDVGVHFRGMSSYGMIPAGLKRSLNLSLDFVHDKQRLYGYKTLNLLNCNGDPSMMKTVLYSAIARKHMPAPKANFVRVVINGESWGLYTNAQQFNKEFVKENYGSSKGERWKVPGRPGGDSGLAYVGDNVEEYKRRYEIKSGDDEKAWKDLIA